MVNFVLTSSPIITYSRILTCLCLQLSHLNTLLVRYPDIQQLITRWRRESKCVCRDTENPPDEIPDTGKQFPKTAYNVTAEGSDFTNMVEVSGDERLHK